MYYTWMRWYVETIPDLIFADALAFQIAKKLTCKTISDWETCDAFFVDKLLEDRQKIVFITSGAPLVDASHSVRMQKWRRKVKDTISLVQRRWADCEFRQDRHEKFTSDLLTAVGDTSLPIRIVHHRTIRTKAWVVQGLNSLEFK